VYPFTIRCTPSTSRSSWKLINSPKRRSSNTEAQRTRRSQDASIAFVLYGSRTFRTFRLPRACGNVAGGLIAGTKRVINIAVPSMIVEQFAHGAPERFRIANAQQLVFLTRIGRYPGLGCGRRPRWVLRSSALLKMLTRCAPIDRLQGKAPSFALSPSLRGRFIAFPIESGSF